MKTHPKDLTIELVPGRSKGLPPLMEAEASPERRPIVLWALLGMAFLAAFSGLFAYYWDRWTAAHSPFGYGFFVPPTVIFLIWCHRHQIRQAPLRSPNGLALAGIILFALVHAVALISAVTILQSVAFMGLLLLVPYYLWGGAIYIHLVGPLLYTATMIPWPGQFTAKLLLPSQLVSTAVATKMMDLAGLRGWVEGTTVFLPNYNFEVAAACSGLTILFPVIAIAILNMMMVHASLARKLLVIAMALPLAVVANGFRIVMIGSIGNYGSPELADKLHDPSGWMAVGVAVIMLMGVQALFGCSNFKDQYMPPFTAESPESEAESAEAVSR
jgi:exosortase